MAQEENVPQTKPKNEEQTNEHNNTTLSRRGANIILYCIVTGILGLLAGIVLNAYNKLPPQIVAIATAFGGLIALISAVLGTIIEKSVPKGISVIWKNANRSLMIMFGTLTVIFLILVVLLVPAIPKGTPTNVTPQAQATATANAIATATLIASHYPFSDKLALNDPLSNNNHGYIWAEVSGEPGKCLFTGGAYHVSISDGAYDCAAKATNFSNFTYEVEMTVIKGNCGGIIFRADDANSKFYTFYICQDGNYLLLLYVDAYASHSKCLAANPSPLISKVQGQTYLIAVVARGDTITLYLNKQPIDQVSDKTYTSGQIGVIAVGVSTATEVVFRNAKVWTL